MSVGKLRELARKWNRWSNAAYGLCAKELESLIPEIEAEISDLKRQLAERDVYVQEAVQPFIADMEHILEYWNKSENDMAMSDALYHIMDIAEAAIIRAKIEKGKE